MRHQPAMPPGSGPCRKQVVTAQVVCPGGDIFEGSNYCEAPQATCPRAGMATGAGYELCKSVCKQAGHAELVALELAGDRARGAVLVVEGHTYACDSCKSFAIGFGIVRLIVAGRDVSLGQPEPRTEFAGSNPFEPS